MSDTRYTFLGVALNVTAASVLVITNKLLLSRNQLQAASTFLTFLHYLVTLITLRASRGILSDEESKRMLHIGKLHFKVLLVSLFGSLGVVSSNLALKLSSVSFHQVSRLLALPLGLLFDYFLYKKTRNIIELLYVCLVAYGVYQVCADDPTASWASIGFAAFSVVATLGTAAAVRRLCTDNGLLAVDFAYLAAPFGALTSGIWLCMALSGEHPRNIVVSENRKDLWETIALLIPNCFSAVLLNVTSAWCAARCSTLMYGIIAQIKTLTIIALSVFFFPVVISYHSCVCLCVSIYAFLVFSVIEHQSTRTQDGSSVIINAQNTSKKSDRWIRVNLVMLCVVLLVSQCKLALLAAPR